MAELIWHDGRWHDSQPRLMGPLDHGFWTGSVAFDAGRAFGGCAPDLDRHCARLVRSAAAIMLRCPLSAETMLGIAIEGIRRFPKDAELYIKLVAFARGGFLLPDAATTDVAISIQDMPMPEPIGLSACLSPYRRPARDMAPTDAKIAGLYPNVQRALADAQARGFQQAIVLDAAGNVAEFASANLWLAKDGVAITPAANGTFLAGITRGRVAELFRAAGTPVLETSVTLADVMTADEVFLTSNFNKVLPVTRLEDRALPPGPLYLQARERYLAFARQCSVF